MNIVVCGSRNWTDKEAIRRELAKLPAGSRVAHGGNGYDAQGRSLWGQPDELAVRGADMLAGSVALELGFTVEVYAPPEWLAGEFKPSSGPKRNTAMLQKEQPQKVLAFTSDLARSRGTADCVEKARRMGIPVLVVGV